MVSYGYVGPPAGHGFEGMQGKQWREPPNLNLNQEGLDGTQAAGACTFVQELIRRRVAGPRITKDEMYDAFLEDVKQGMPLNDAIPMHTPSQGSLRVLTWNVHFFQRGYSGVEHGCNRDEVKATVARLNPDVILIQEGVPGVEELFPNYPYTAVAAEPEVSHTLPDTIKSAPGTRLLASVHSKLPLDDATSVPLGSDTNGNSAYALLSLPGGMKVGFHSVHLSVRCPASVRRMEIEATAAHCLRLKDR